MELSSASSGAWDLRPLRQSLDPAQLPAAGRPSRGDSILNMRRGPKPPPLSTDNGHVGQLSVERDVPSFPRLRHPEFMLSTVDIEGATPKPAPGEVLGPRVLASGDASLKKNSRNLNPNVPVYTWNSHSSIAPENLLTPPSDEVKGVLPIGGRAESDTCDRYPQTRLLLRPGSKNDARGSGCADIEGAAPASAMGIQPRRTLHPSVDYSDVVHSSPHAWRHDAGQYTAFAGQLGQTVMVPGPEGKRGDNRPPVDGAQFPPAHWRTVPTHPLDPQYTFDPVGQMCRFKTQMDLNERKSPAAIAARKQANGEPEGELMGRMDDLRHQGPLERGSVRKYATKTGFSRIHVNRPFPVVTGYQMTL